MGGVIAATAACQNNGRCRRKPSKLVLLITIFSLVIGLFVPLVIIFSMNGTSSMTRFPLIMIFILMIGIIVAVVTGLTESLDQDDETEDDLLHRNSRKSYHAKQRPRRTSYREYEPREDNYWGSESKSTAFFCTNCGLRLESDDRFCSSCGWRVN